MALLLIQEDAEIREKLAFSLESTFGDDVVQAGDFSEALARVKESGASVSLILYDVGAAEQPATNPRTSELQELHALTAHSPMMLCEDAKKRPLPKLPWKLLAGIERADMIPRLIQALTRLCEEGAIDLRQNEEDFCKIKTKLLLSVCPLEGDIYIRLSERKFVKLFREGDAFDLDDMEKYTVRKGVEHLYLRRESLPEFIQKYCSDLQKVLASVQSLTPQDAARVHASIYETVQECGRRIGFTKDVQQVAKHHVQLVLKQMGKNPRLGQVLERIRASNDQYIGSHSLTVGYLACAIAYHLEWGSEVTFHKLTLAAFLHDVTLEDHALAHCNTLAEVKDLGYSAEVIADYKTHPIKSSQIAQQFHEVPADVDTIILQHHERPDGTGFPRGIGHAYIAPLAAVFIVAHDMAQHFIDHDQNLLLEDFVARTREQYKTSQFRKVMEAVEKLN
jgi:HD-GYP domain-containing protein (c-di-GMP phosphodiesterase class II)